MHLSTTDPAAHVAEALAGELSGLTIGKIDPAAETEAYRQQVLTTTGTQTDEAGRALLEEDLRSPCTEEIAVFRAFAREVGQGTGRFVVLDTAPTGHRCYCSIPITASLTAWRDPRSLRKFCGCSSACVIPSSRAS